MDTPHLYLIVLGGHPEGRNIEQHDVVFAVGETIDDTFDTIKKHWDVPGLHIDSYMFVEQIDGFDIALSLQKVESERKLYFVNLGGYRENDLEEYHKKILVRAATIDEAKKVAKQDVFFSEGLQETNARSHVDDRMEMVCFDVDDVLVVNDSIEPKYFIHFIENLHAKFANNAKTIGYRVLRKSTSLSN